MPNLLNLTHTTDAPAAGSAGIRVGPKTPASWLLSAGQCQTAAPLPVGSDPRSVPRNDPPIKLHHLHPPPSAITPKGYLLPEFYSGATGLTGRFNEGFLLRRLHAGRERTRIAVFDLVRLTPDLVKAFTQAFLLSALLELFVVIIPF